MASTKLTRTQTAGTDRKKFTLSMWVKTSVPSTMSGLWCTEGGWYDGSGMACVLRHDDGSGILTIYNPSEGGTGGNYNSTSHKFRDCNGWYHFVWAGDTTQATQADRLKIYVNGEQISYTTNNLPAQNVFWNDLNSNNKTFTIGAGSGSGHYYFEGSMSHVHFSDGYVYNASTFGSTDATTGEWKINTAPSFTLGNNGFTILKDGNTYTDQSSNSNNFTLSGTLTKTEDCPDNVFATMNPLSQTNSNMTFSNGNTKISSASSWLTAPSTIGFTKGKWYWEVKYKQKGQLASGVAQEEVVTTPRNSTLNTRASDYAHAYELLSNGGAYSVTGNGGTGGTSITSDISENDIIMWAFDATNGALWVGNNGTWLNSATKSEIEAGTTTNAIYSSMSGANDKTWFVVGSPEATGNGSTHGQLEFNFGNGYFGTTAVSSAGTNASGIGIFEYDVPSGYTALSTKGLNE